jgi:hypothetical protein
MVVIVFVFVVTVIIIIVFVTVIVITPMQGIYNYIPETDRVPRVYSISDVLYLQFVLHVKLFHMLNVLYFYVSTF